LAVLKGRKAGVGNYKDNRWSGLYHDLKAKNTSTVLNLYLNENQDSYNLSVSQKVDGGDPRRAGGRLTLGEASLLLAFLEAHLPAYFAAQTAKQEQEWAARRNEAGGEPAKPTQPAKAASAPSKAPTGAKAPTVSSIANSGRSKPPAAHEDDIPF
jgi:hypothetical protein